MRPDSRQILTTRPIGIVVAVLLMAVGTPACGAAGDKARESSERFEDLGSRICEPRSASSIGRWLDELETQDGATSLIDRPWIRECVESTLDTIAADVDRYCAGLRRLSSEDPVVRSREADLRHTLVLAYRDLVRGCQVATGIPQAGASSDRPPTVEDDELLSRTSREWCYDTQSVFERFKGIAADDDVSGAGLECLDQNRARFIAEMDQLCAAGWTAIGDGPTVIYRWYASCGVAN